MILDKALNDGLLHHLFTSDAVQLFDQHQMHAPSDISATIMSESAGTSSTVTGHALLFEPTHDLDVILVGPFPNGAFWRGNPVART